MSPGRPPADVGRTSPEPNMSIPAARPPNPAVLVVDDEPLVRSLLGHVLQSRGYRFLPAAGGVEAVGLYREHAAAIGLVLLEVQIAGMDGPRTLAALRHIDPHVRCCFMS